jgi:hypothetical protein
MTVKIWKLVAIWVLASSFSSGSMALIIGDHYAGGGDTLLAPYNVSRDVLGGDIYEVYSMEVTTATNLMSVTIHTDFIETDVLNIGNYIPGDLFLSTDGWNPFVGNLGDPYYEDDASNGTTR